MKFLLIGQPNCGKSTIFNEVIGYKSLTSNFPGSSITFTEGELYLKNSRINIIDLPGTYSLHSSEKKENETLNFLTDNKDDTVIINIMDASVISRSLELTLQLMEMKIPMVIVLNMADEAEKKGIKIDSEKLSELTGVPVIKTIAHRGTGVYSLFEQAIEVYKKKTNPKTIKISPIIEYKIEKIIDILKKSKVSTKFNYRFLALMVIEKK